MDEDGDKELGCEAQSAAPWPVPSAFRLRRSGEGMASVLEHLRQQLRQRTGESLDDAAAWRGPDDTRPPEG